MTFLLTGTWAWCPVEVWELYGRFGSDGVKNIGQRSFDPQASREAAKGRLRGVLPVASGPQCRYASYASQASDAIGSFEPAGRVADDARDATSKIPRPTAGDPPPHVPRDEASPSSPGRVAAHRASLICWSYSSNFTGSHLRHPAGNSHTLAPIAKRSLKGHEVGVGSSLCMHVRRRTLLRGSHSRLPHSDPCPRRFLPDPVTVSRRDKRLPWAV